VASSTSVAPSSRRHRVVAPSAAAERPNGVCGDVSKLPSLGGGSCPWVETCSPHED
jgi:hypothetical protein